MDKNLLRQMIRARKQEMTAEEICRRSEILGQMLSRCECYQRAGTLYGYLPFNQEVRLVPILEQALREGKRIALPRMEGRELVFHYMTDFTRIVPGPKGIPEPSRELPIAREEEALVILPGLAFDPSGNRMGYGGGYYDRFLAREPKHPTIALCYDFQMVARLEPEPHDIPVQRVLWA